MLLLLGSDLGTAVVLLFDRTFSAFLTVADSSGH